MPHRSGFGFQSPRWPPVQFNAAVGMAALGSGLVALALGRKRAAGILSLILVGAGILRRQRGGWLRAAAGLILFLALLNPVALREDRDPLPTVVALVTDESASQALDGRDEVTAISSSLPTRGSSGE